MKLISWNIKIKNKKFRKGFDFILKQNPDVICLQEVSNPALEYWKNTKYNIYSVRNSLGKKKSRYKLILSKKKGTSHSFITQNFEIKSPWRKLSNFKFGFDKELHNGIYVDFNNLRIINLHLDACSGPVYRNIQLRKALRYIAPKKNNIVCGDLNSYGNILINSLLWPPLRYPFKHISANEKKELYKLFKEHKLRDIFKGEKTYVMGPLRFQVDHFLLTKKIKVISKKVYRKKYNSDHRILELNINF